MVIGTEVISTGTVVVMTVAPASAAAVPSFSGCAGPSFSGNASFCILDDGRSGRDNEADDSIEYDDEDDGDALDKEARERTHKEYAPECMQLVTSTLVHNSLLALHAPLPEEELEEAAMGVISQLPSRLRGHLVEGGSSSNLGTPLIEAVAFVLKLLFIDEMELGLKYCALHERKKALHAMYRHYGIHNEYFKEDLMGALKSVEMGADAMEWLTMKCKDQQLEEDVHGDEEPKMKKPSCISAYKVAKKGIVSHLARGFSIEPSMTVHYANDLDINPVAYAEQFLTEAEADHLVTVAIKLQPDQKRQRKHGMKSMWRPSPTQFSPDYIVACGVTFEQMFSADGLVSSFLLHLPWMKIALRSDIHQRSRMARHHQIRSMAIEHWIHLYKVESPLVLFVTPGAAWYFTWWAMRCGLCGIFDVAWWSAMLYLLADLIPPTLFTIAKQQHGGVVIRPSSKGISHLTVTWKADNQLYQHIDIMESNADPTGQTVGGLIIDKNHTYSDLNDLIVNHVQAMAHEVEELMMHKHFKLGKDDDLHTFLKNQLMANPAKSMYGFTLNRKCPGHFNLYFLANRNAPMRTWAPMVDQHMQQHQQQGMEHGQQQSQQQQASHSGGQQQQSMLSMHYHLPMLYPNAVKFVHKFDEVLAMLIILEVIARVRTLHSHVSDSPLDELRQLTPGTGILSCRSLPPELSHALQLGESAFQGLLAPPSTSAYSFGASPKNLDSPQLGNGLLSPITGALDLSVPFCDGDARTILFSKIQELQKANRGLKSMVYQLQVALKVAQTENAALKYAYKVLVARVPNESGPKASNNAVIVNVIARTPDGTGSSDHVLATPMAPVYNHADFPCIKYWYRSQWNQYLKSKEGVSKTAKAKGKRGNSRASRGINVTMQYVDDETGATVDGFRAGFIHSTAHSIFYLLRDRGLAPVTWGQATPPVITCYCNQLILKCPEMSYCTENWKAMFLATEIYPSWYKVHGQDMSCSLKHEDVTLDLLVKSTTDGHNVSSDYGIIAES
ncbi:hypothetical protein FISHEDRAFT_63136 [Fistulina hepatica ATCC 64428]|uniref:Spt6 SH2 domain-containing protein n=1 Tax=Fistulina hepatica ATCC 64428 TaxID=1128425 RepID=A0A0D6ZYK0_9AGAR|nr:hypothetical protein FISHEDRAFT_63136 [Fistulina hepatica ATCC 64428]